MKLPTFPLLGLIMLSSSFLYGMDEENLTPPKVTIKNAQGEMITFDEASYNAYMNLQDKGAFDRLISSVGLENYDGPSLNFPLPEEYQLVGTQEVRLGEKLEQPNFIRKKRIIPQCNGECGDGECCGQCVDEGDDANNNKEG